MWSKIKDKEHSKRFKIHRGKFLAAGMICTTTDTISIPMGEMYYMQECSVCTCSYVFYSHGCNKFLHARTFFALTDTKSILMFAIYLHARMFCTLAPYVFYSHGCNVRAWNLFWASVTKPVLWQLMILLPCTLARTSSIPMDAINFYMRQHFFTLADTIAPIFTVLTEAWPHAYRAMVTNN